MKASRWLVPLALATGVLVGLALGHQPMPSAPPVPQPAPRMTAVAAVDTTALRADVRRIVAEECHATPKATEAAAPAPPPSPTAEQEDAHVQALALVEGAIAVGRWDADNARSMRQLLAVETEDQREDVIHTLLPALNSGHVRVETGPMPPF